MCVCVGVFVYVSVYVCVFAGHVHTQPGMWKLELLSVKATNHIVLINLLSVIFNLKYVVCVQLVAADCLYQAD